MLERIRLGDKTALSSLADESWTPLVLYLEKILGSRDAAQDIAQEALVRMWERREKWVAGSARALLFRIGRNLALDTIDRERVRSRWERRQRLEPRPTPPTPEEEVEASESLVMLREALDGLPQRRREVVDMIRFRGFSYAEVSEALGISHQTVANHLSLAFRDLRHRLDPELEEPHREPGAMESEGSKDG